MAVAIAYQVPASSQPALEEAVRQAAFRGSELIVIHVAETFDQDDADHYLAGISDDIEKALSVEHIPSVNWRLELTTPENGKNVEASILRICAESAADLLVIGARRRSPVGKALLGSLAQNLILDAEIPVVVVKAD